MKLAIPVVLVSVAIAFGPVAASGESPPEDSILAALVTEALERNPDVLAALAIRDGAVQRTVQAASLPDPMLSVGYTNDGWAPTLGSEPMTTLALMASQDLPFPGKRRLRRDIASREAELVGQQLARVRLRVAADVKRAYYGLLLARELQELTREQRETWREIEGVVRARYAVGQGAQQDVLRVQIELTRVEQSAAEQDAEADIRLAELNRLLARPPDSPLETTGRSGLRPAGRPLAAVLEEARARSPELASARIVVERGRLAIALAQREYQPDLALQAGYVNRGGLAPMWQAGVGVTLPVLRGKRAAAVAEAQAAARGTERAEESIDLQLRYRTQERLTRLESTERIVGLYEKGIIPQDRMSVEAAIANYQTGKVPFVAVLEAQQALYADRWTLARLLAEHSRLVAGMEEASLEANVEMAGAGPSPAAIGSGPATMAGGMGGR